MVGEWQITARRDTDHLRHLAHLGCFFGSGMIGKIELHHTLAQPLQTVTLRAHRHAIRDRCRAGGGRAGAALDLDQADPARTERLHRIGGAELRNVGPGEAGGAHDRGAGRHGDPLAVDRQGDAFDGGGGGRAAIGIADQGHDAKSRGSASAPIVPDKEETAKRAERSELHRLAELLNERDLAATSSPAMIRSITSIPAPSRSGRACTCRSFPPRRSGHREARHARHVDAVSNTTMPAWPINPSAAAKAHSRRANGTSKSGNRRPTVHRPGPRGPAGRKACRRLCRSPARRE